jgi:hypothetical protein
LREALITPIPGVVSHAPCYYLWLVRDRNKGQDMQRTVSSVEMQGSLGKPCLFEEYGMKDAHCTDELEWQDTALAATGIG